MKKVLLLLFLFLNLSIYAQDPPGMEAPYYVCDDSSNDGFAVFDLTSTIPAILSSVDPSIHEVHFYPSDTDSANDTNEITNPSAYVNSVQGLQTIGIRIINTALNETHLAGMNLVVNPLPTATISGTSSVCQNSANPTITFTGAGGTPPYTITYLDPAAVSHTISTTVGNSVTLPVPIATSGTFIYSLISVQSAAGCSQNQSGSAVITVNPQPNAGTNGTLTVCDTNTTPIDLYSLITGEEAGGLWTRAAGTGGTFNAVAGTYTPAVGATTSTFTYTLTGTAPCINNSSTVTIFVNCNPQPVCGGVFTDNGGLGANYTNNSNTTTIICPTTPGDAVTVTFTSFNTEALYDALYVYNGTAVTPSALIPSTNAVGNVPGGVPGGYWGNLTGVNLPGPFTSSSLEGCLTFVFRSDASNNLEGWVANVSCDPVLCEVPTALTVSSITNTSAVIGWNNISFSSEVLILPQGSPVPTESSQGVVAQGNTYVASGLPPNGCYTAYVRTLCAYNTDWSNPVDFCMFNCENTGNCTDSLSLIAFLDSNNNGIKDSGETNFTYGNFIYQVNDSVANQYGTSSNGLYYIFDSNPNNSYDIQFYLQANLSAYYTSSVTQNNITLPTGSGNTILYFPIINTNPHVDAWVNLSPQGQPRPGFSYSNYISYQNRGTQTIPSGTITFTKGPNVSITSTFPADTNATPTGFTYNFTNLAPAEMRAIVLTFLVPTLPTVALGDLITNTVAIQIDNDIDLSNNLSSISQTIVASYDPNDKMESHGGKIVHANFTANDYLYYTIQFENTGTANAEFIRVEDVLNSQLDESTFEMINASHNVNTKRVGNQLTWHFYNINLPPTSLNPSGSHGFVSFRIKPKAGYAIGDIIPNTASIYFDYNPAIVTNTFNTEFVQALGNTTFNANTISLSPNPANSNVNITNSNSSEKISKVTIYDVTGKRIYTLENNTLSVISIDVSHFTKGVYLVELASDNNSKITKKLILK